MRLPITSLALLLPLIPACKSAPAPELLVPETQFGVQHYSGSVLSGPRPTAEATTVAPDQALTVFCRVSYVASIPDGALQPLAARTRLVVAARGDDPLLPSARLALGADIGSGTAARNFLQAMSGGGRNQVRRMFEARGALPEGVTVAFHGEPTQSMFTAGLGEVRRRISILVAREAGGELNTALMIDNRDVDVEPGEDADVLERQIVLLQDTPVIGGEPLVVAVPSPFDPAGRTAFVAEVSLGRANQSRVHQAAVAQCVNDLRRSGAETAAEARPLNLGEAERQTILSSLRALDLAERHRAAIVFLTSTNRAPLALDLALSADSTTLGAWVQLFLTETGAATFDQESVGRELAWALDRTAWKLLADRLDEGELAPGLRGIMAIHAGEVGRFPGEIVEAIERSADRAEFEAEILADNRNFLASPDPAARVRAYDWLLAREQAPANYDPLAPRDERRAALNADARLRRAGEKR